METVHLLLAALLVTGDGKAIKVLKELYYVYHYSLVLLVVPGMVISIVVVPVLSIVLILALVTLRLSVA